MSGKGDGYRPVDKAKFDSNWDRIFANTKGKDSVKHLDREIEKALGRCPNTVDIEEMIAHQMIDK